MLHMLPGHLSVLILVQGLLVWYMRALDQNITMLSVNDKKLDRSITELDKKLDRSISELKGKITELTGAFQAHTGRAFQAIKLLDSCSVPLTAGTVSFVLTLLDSNANTVKIVTAAHVLPVLLAERANVSYPAVPKYYDDATPAATRLQLPKDSPLFRHDEWQLDPKCDLAILVVLKKVARTLFQDYEFCKPAPAESYPRSGQEVYFFASNQQLEFSTGPVAGTAGRGSDCPDAVLVYAPIRKAFSGSPVAIDGQVAGVAVREEHEEQYWVRSRRCSPEHGGDRESKGDGDPSANRLYALFVPIKSLDAWDNKYRSSRFTFWVALATFSVEGRNHTEELGDLACKMLIEVRRDELWQVGNSLHEMLCASCGRCAGCVCPRASGLPGIYAL